MTYRLGAARVQPKARNQTTRSARATAALAKAIGAQLALALTAATVSGAAFAAFPDKPVRIIVPFAPGGGTDLIARMVGEGMSRELGQPVIVENKPGAGTIIGTDMVAKSAPDGYTIVISTFAHAVNPSMMSKMPYQNSAFTPVILIGRSPNILVMRPDRPFKTVKDIIAYARANPGKLTYGSQGNGTSAHLAGALFANLAKVDITHVPYRGAGPAITDLLGGQIDVMWATSSAVGSHIENGRLRAVAVTTSERSPAMKDVPTIAEAGVPGYAAESWYGLYAPAGTPKDVVMRLNTAAKKAIASDAFQKRVAAEGLVPSAGEPEELDRYVRNEEARWRKVVKEANITAD